MERSPKRQRGNLPEVENNAVPTSNGRRAPPPPQPAATTRPPPPISRAGGVYIPPFKLAQMMAAETDKTSEAYQRLTWDALRKSLNGLVNKANVINVKHILPDLFSENLIRGRGLLCKALLKSQVASPLFTPVYAALLAVVNTKFPEIGELLLHRIVLQFKKAFKRNDKPLCTASLRFIAHLVNQQVAHELLALEVLFLLLSQPSDDSVQVACAFVLEVGAFLGDVNAAGLRAVYDRLRDIVQEGTNVSKRTQYVVEALFASWKKGFATDNPAVREGLDLVEIEDQITHEVSLDDAVQPHTELDVFRFDPDYDKHEAEYSAIKKELLGDDDDDDDGSSGDEEGGESSSSEEEEDDSDEEEEEGEGAGGIISTTTTTHNNNQEIEDLTGTDLVNLRRTIYLAIQSSLTHEEAGHKILRMNIPEKHSFEIVTMIIECASQEKTHNKMYSLLAERFCKLRRYYEQGFAQAFHSQYTLVHRLETNKVRNVAKLFSHLFATDALPWSVMGCIRLTEEDTTSSSRIFIKFLFQELAEELGMKKLVDKVADPVGGGFEGLFPTDSARNMRFSINFFTSIGLGAVTDRMRDLLKEAQIQAAQQAAALKAAAEEDKKKKKNMSKSESRGRRKRRSSSPSSSSSSSSDSDSDSDSSTTKTSSRSGDSGSTSSYTSSSSSSLYSSSSDSGSEDSRDRRRRGGGRRRKRTRSGSRKRR
jgi:pre-mRNA-splicing factor CWC22